MQAKWTRLGYSLDFLALDLGYVIIFIVCFCFCYVLELFWFYFLFILFFLVCLIAHFLIFTLPKLLWTYYKLLFLLLLAYFILTR